MIKKNYANGSTYAFTYDNANRLAARTDALGQTTTYTYHPDGSLASLTDARASAYTFVVDALSRRTRMNYPGDSYETWTYDANSNMTQYRTRAGVTMSCTFDNRRGGCGDVKRAGRAAADKTQRDTLVDFHGYSP
jgi:hypothetical protein